MEGLSPLEKARMMVLWNTRCAPISKSETGTERKDESKEGYLGARCSMNGLKKTGISIAAVMLARRLATLGWTGRRMIMADFMCMVMNVTLCLAFLALGVLAVETIWKTVRKFIVGNKED